jgi:apolipoprotein N-acyltransferase
MIPKPRKPRNPRALAVVAAASLAWGFCYPPFPLGPLAFVVLAPFFAALSGLSRGQAFRYAFAGGILYNAVMYWWIYNVVKVGPALVIGAGLVVLILFLSLANGLLGWLFRVVLDRPYGLLYYPLLWAGLEVVRTWGQMSFPWNHLGYALGHHAALIQAASFLGVFGLSALAVAANALLFSAWRLRRERPSNLGRKAAWAQALAAAAIPAALWIHGAVSLGRPDPEAGFLDIGLVQPSIPQTKKWDEHYFRDVMQKTWRTLDGGNDSLVPRGALQGADLIVLPETAVPDFMRSRDDIQARLARTARVNGADLIVGALDFEPDDKPYRSYKFYNSAFFFPGGGGPDSISRDSASLRATRQYSKLRLVPFSERLPFDDIFPLINYVNLGEGDFSAGAGYAVWERKAHDRETRYAPSICYEVIYPDFVRGARRHGAVLLVNITNDGWFGFSNAPFQHANITRFRAVEAGMPIARSANTGISLFYDYKGRILGKTRLFEETVLRRKVPLAHRDTFYLRYGGWMEGILGIGFLLAVPALLWVARSRPLERA